MSSNEILYPSPTEASYASPVLSPTMAGEPVRHKRSNRSSVNKVYPNGFEEEDLRAGGPNLCEPPCYSVEVPKGHRFYNELCVKDDYSNAILTMAEQSHISVSDISFVGRKSRCVPSDEVVPVLTALLTTRRHNPTHRGWAEFARKVWSYLKGCGIGEITVEIVDQRFNRNPYMFPCKREDDIYPIWGQVCGEIIARIDLMDILSVGCHRVGNAEVPESCVPNILVAVSSKSKRNWNAVRDEIVSILMEAQVHTAGVIIERDVSLVLAGDLVSQKLLAQGCKSEANVGTSIGPHGSPQDQGTLGGFIELKNPSTGQWVEFALTCYHCTLPNDKELARYSDKDFQIFSNWNRHGVRITDKNASRLLMMDSPTQRDIQDGISGLDSLISSVENAAEYQKVSRAIEEDEYVIGPEMARWKAHNKHIQRFNADKEYMQGYLDKGRYRLGTVFAASGFREELSSTVNLNPTMLPTVRDWALIRPLEGRSLGKNNFAEISKLLGVDKMEFLERGASVDSSWILHKFGRRTGETIGRYNGLAEARIARSYVDGNLVVKATLEHTVVSNDSKDLFELSGDSGAFVYTITGEVVGMCFGGPERGKVGYFTHIHDILDDIEKITGVKEIRLKQ